MWAGGTERWKPLTARVGRSGAVEVDGGCELPLSAKWAQNVDGGGQLTWSQVDGDRGQPAGR